MTATVLELMNLKLAICFSRTKPNQCVYGMLLMRTKIYPEKFTMSVSAIIYTSKTFFHSHDLVKDAKCNGNVRGLGNSNRLSLTLFIQQSILAFYKRPETKQSKRPLDWMEVVDAMLLHFVGDHSSCECLER